ncbi:MAG: nuclear transport factor 2 family protein [Rhodothermaceae bacterium]|nr:nuclear transport factor 2 family protein [Rhodothermaceae bacterium]
MKNIGLYASLFSVILLGLGLTWHPPSEASNSPDRDAILKTIENFYIGDHTGSLEHKQLSMHPEGAYRYVDRDGAYQESQFRLVESRGDTIYTEELLSVEIYETVALARLRLENQRREEAEYKLMTLHKTSEGWLITSIAWGWGVTQ